jgi:hypothetical protein
VTATEWDDLTGLLAARPGALLGLSEGVQLRGLPADQTRKTIALLRPIALSDDPLNGLASGVLRSMAQAKAEQADSSPRGERQWAVARRIAVSAGALVAHRCESFTDEVLTDLVAELLFDTDSEARLTAATLVAATPYRNGTASALAKELRTAAAGHPDWPSRLLPALRLLDGEGERPLLERIVTAKGLPRETVEVAAYSVGHVAPTGLPNWWSQAIESQLRRPEPDAEILKGLAYSAGLSATERFARFLGHH